MVIPQKTRNVLACGHQGQPEVSLYILVVTYFGDAHGTAVRVDIGRAGNANLGARINEFLGPLGHVAEVTSYNEVGLRTQGFRVPGGLT